MPFHDNDHHPQNHVSSGFSAELDLDDLQFLADQQAEMVVGGGVITKGAPGLVKNIGTGLINRPGIRKNVINGNGFASDQAGNNRTAPGWEDFTVH